MISSVISAKFVFKVGEFHWSVTIFGFSFFLSLLTNHKAKFIFPAAGVEP